MSGSRGACRSLHANGVADNETKVPAARPYPVTQHRMMFLREGTIARSAKTRPDSAGVAHPPPCRRGSWPRKRSMKGNASTETIAFAGTARSYNHVAHAHRRWRLHRRCRSGPWPRKQSMQGSAPPGTIALAGMARSYNRVARAHRQWRPTPPWLEGLMAPKAVDERKRFNRNHRSRRRVRSLEVVDPTGRNLREWRDRKGALGQAKRFVDQRAQGLDGSLNRPDRRQAGRAPGHRQRTAPVGRAHTTICLQAGNPDERNHPPLSGLNTTSAGASANRRSASERCACSHDFPPASIPCAQCSRNRALRRSSAGVATSVTSVSASGPVESPAGTTRPCPYSLKVCKGSLEFAGFGAVTRSHGKQRNMCGGDPLDPRAQCLSWPCSCPNHSRASEATGERS
jgi:hypothetical protein